MLEVEDLTVEVGGREIIHDVSFNIDIGETLALFGPNGSGKTTLLMAIMGFPRYEVTRGRILFNREDITHLPVDERSRMGIGILFQRPPVVRGVKMREMVRACLGGREDGAVIEQLAQQANMVELLDREVNYGFSGGEVKRSELLQLIAQSPEFVLLDEPDSGVDLVNISLVGEMINDLLQKDRMRNRTSSGLIITHTGHILDYVSVDRACVLLNGGIWCRGNPREILTSIKSHGYEGCAVCQK
ncbi:MAG: ABC transporter ATP-binding protein [Dehalococcoidia bacterium]|nr:MAG: ABC transporter ATP-binding protein [Dehalococcoidia bacterium]